MTHINVPVPQKITFQGDDLLSVMIDGEIFAVMKPIVVGMGMDWRRQSQKIQDSQRYGHMSTPLKTAGGIQKMLCIPHIKLNTWLFSINPEKVKPEIRDQVIAYQEECSNVLYKYWHYGEAVNPRFQDDENAVSHDLYFIRIYIENVHFVKIGISNGVVKRIRSIQTGCPVPITHYASVGFRDEKSARRVEAALHDLFRKYRTKGEWFRIENQEDFTEKTTAVCDAALGKWTWKHHYLTNSEKAMTYTGRSDDQKEKLMDFFKTDLGPHHSPPLPDFSNRKLSLNKSIRKMPMNEFRLLMARTQNACEEDEDMSRDNLLHHARRLHKADLVAGRAKYRGDTGDAG